MIGHISEVLEDGGSSGMFSVLEESFDDVSMDEDDEEETAKMLQ